jgi:hypothetical protein
MTGNYFSDLENEQKELQEERKTINKKLEKTPILRVKLFRPGDDADLHGYSGKTHEYIILKRRLKEIDQRLLEVKEYLHINNLLK